MSQTSMSQYVTAVTVGSQIVAGGFLGSTPVFALSDGRIMLGGADGATVTAHEDAAILFGQCDGSRIVTGGDDGRVVVTQADGSFETVAHEKGRWIDALAMRPDGALAWSAGKEVRARDAKGEVKSMTAASTVRGLAFMPKGYRLAIGHYNGVSLWFPNSSAAPEAFTWAGSHLDVTVSPDGRFLVSAMQENALHGWRIADRKDMRMTGYPSKTRSFSWSADGNWLATSGAEACIVWPFQSKDGPMGKGPRECGVRPARVTRVAFHPRSLVVAIGYQDGWVMICRLTDAAEILVRAVPEDQPKGGAISCLAWSADGARLVYGADDGVAGVLDLPAA